MDTKQANQIARAFGLNDQNYASSVLKIVLPVPEINAKVLANGISELFGNSNMYPSATRLVYRNNKGTITNVIEQTSFVIESVVDLSELNKQGKTITTWIEAFKTVFVLSDILVQVDHYTYLL